MICSAFCPFGDDESTGYNRLRGLSIVFHEDLTVDLIQDGVITETSSLRVVDTYYGDQELETDPGISEIGSYIWICEEWVIFNYSYIELCDNYYSCNP